MIKTKRLNILSVVLILVLAFTSLFLFLYRRDIKAAKDSFFEDRKLVDAASLSDGQVVVTDMENGKETFIEYMRSQGWEHREEEQLGSRYCFQNRNGEKRFFLCRNLKEIILWMED